MISEQFAAWECKKSRPVSNTFGRNMRSLVTFLAGFVVAAVIFGGGWYASHQYGIPRNFPEQIVFDSLS